MSSQTKLVTLEQYAGELKIRGGWMLYVRHKQPDFPRPVLRRGRETYFDREEVKQFLKDTFPHYKAFRC